MPYGSNKINIGELATDSAELLRIVSAVPNIDRVAVVICIDGEYHSYQFNCGQEDLAIAGRLLVEFSKPKYKMTSN